MGSHIHSILATLRHDGSPRLSGLETNFSEGELWLAMMPDSRKADDLRRDPRFALHSSPQTELVEGDAKINGHAIAVTDLPTIERFVGELPQEPPRVVSACSAPSSPMRRSRGSRRRVGHRLVA